MGTMTKKKLISEISQEKKMHPNDVRKVVQAFLDKMTGSLATGDRLEFRDFGVFEVVRRRQKIGRNPKNASVPIIIPARNAVKFTPGKKMRRLIEEEEGTEQDRSTVSAGSTSTMSRTSSTYTS
jgi:integration host factor subunit beta